MWIRHCSWRAGYKLSYSANVMSNCKWCLFQPFRTYWSRFVDNRQSLQKSVNDCFHVSVYHTPSAHWQRVRIIEEVFQAHFIVSVNHWKIATGSTEHKKGWLSWAVCVNRCVLDFIVKTIRVPNFFNARKSSVVKRVNIPNIYIIKILFLAVALCANLELPKLNRQSVKA